MKKNLLFLLLLMIGITVAAQQTYQDVVYLKTGAIIHGTIIEQVPNKSIKIETSDKNVFVYQIDEIEKMSKEAVVTGATANSNAGMKSGYVGIFNFGYGFGLGDVGKGYNFLKIDLINGYQFNPYISFGVGTGLKYCFFKGVDQNSIWIPVFGDLRVHILDNNISPYVALGLGYTFEVSPISQGLGLMVNPSFGVSFKTGNRSTVTLGIGYLSQRISEADESVGSLHFDFGVSF